MLVDHFSLIAAVALGLTFLVSGWSKLQDPNGFVLGVLEYQVLPAPLAILYARILPIAEVATGLALVAGLWRGVFGLIALVLLLSFLIAVTINILRGRKLDCHCFGSQRGEPLGLLTVIRIFILLAFAAVVIRGRSDEPLVLLTADWVPTLLSALGLFLGLYLLGTFPTVWNILHVTPNQGTRASGGRVSFRGLPLDQHGSKPVSANVAGAGGQSE